MTDTFEGIQPELPQSQPDAPITGEEMLADRIRQISKGENRTRRRIAGSFLATSAVSAVAFFSGSLNHFKITHTMPYEAEAQHIVDGIDGVMGDIGEAALPLAIGAIGVVKWRAQKDVRMHAIDRYSSKDMSSDNTSGQPTIFRRVLRNGFAGRVPVMAAIGASLATFSASIGQEVGQGPERAVSHALTTLVPGKALAVGYNGVMPMVESKISWQLANRIKKVAQSEGVNAKILDDDLGDLTVGKGNNTSNLSDLAFGIDRTSVTTSSPLYWTRSEGCQNIPIAVDSISGISKNSNVEIDGVNAKAVETISGDSAINRVAVVMSQEAMAECLHKEDEAPVYAVDLDTSVDNAADILKTANTGDETSTIISKSTFLKNSKKFWDANVKPITNVMALFAGLFSFVAMGSSIRERLKQSRRELAAKSASKITDGTIRAIELMRATKDGVLASIVGFTGALAAPLVANTLESGFQAGVDLKSAMVGSAVAIVGSVAGGLRSLAKPQKIIDMPENTRG